jgi:anti-sigma factor RsiW
MNPAEPPGSDMPCRELVRLITAYLDDALPEDAGADIDSHLDSCAGCRNVLAQWHTVIALAGRLTEADVEHTDELARDRLLSTFRALRRR